jgi:hypothetical protein
VVFCGSEVWSFTLREEQRLKMVENKALRRMSGLKEVEIIGVWRKPRTDELHNLYSSSHTSRMLSSKDTMGLECSTRAREVNPGFL